METDLRSKLRKEVEKAMRAWSSQEMTWGIDDCMMAVADIVLGATGRDPAKSVRGRYKTKLGAYRILRDGGPKKHAFGTAKKMGWKRIKAVDAQAGDVGLIGILVMRKNRREVTHAAAVCRARGWFIVRARFGFVAVPAHQIKFAWSVDA